MCERILFPNSPIFSTFPLFPQVPLDSAGCSIVSAQCQQYLHISMSLYVTNQQSTLLTCRQRSTMQIYFIADVLVLKSYILMIYIYCCHSLF